MITVTLIRHGESLDNPKGIWSGWTDSPLSGLGERQATALGVAFNASSTTFTQFYSSDLKRAHATALAVIEHHAEPKPSIKLTEDLREQHFGIAEGHPWSPRSGLTSDNPEELYSKGIYPELYGREAKFPRGETLGDVIRRADKAIQELILPRVFDKNQNGAHIGITSHGLFLSEIIPGLLKLDSEATLTKSYRGHWNTAWSRMEISLRGDYPDYYNPNSPPPLCVRLVAFNSHEHLSSLPPPASKNDKARAFFSGVTATPEVTVAASQ